LGAKPAANTPTRYKIGFRPNREIFFSGTDPLTHIIRNAADHGIESKGEDYGSNWDRRIHGQGVSLN
jgi:hypothetical protein